MFRKLGFVAIAAVLVSFGPAHAEDENFVSFRAMTPELALEMAQATLLACRGGGYQVGVAVVDRGGVMQVFLRDRFAGPHTVDTAMGKAWTAVSFRTATSDLADMTQAGQPQSGVRQVPGALMIGGGVVIESQGEVVGAIGVSGAPGGDLDESCAQAGIEAVADKLEPL
jgi:uncharacterized protein GlcG (DUF336 family)